MSTIAYSIARESRTAHEAGTYARTVSENVQFIEILDMTKYTFDDGSFLCVRDRDDGDPEVMTVNPRNGASLMRYARWVGLACVAEVCQIMELINALEPASPLIN